MPSWHERQAIEIDPTAAEIATVAMWLTDYQMNQRWASGYKRIPLASKANIHQGNALRTDWNAVIAAAKVSFIVGNPPFLGYTQQSAEQKADMALIFAENDATKWGGALRGMGIDPLSLSATAGRA